MTSQIHSELREDLDRVAALDRILVASDYDGTMAPIVADPTQAFPEPRATAALAGLATTPGVTAAIVSGRSRAQLRTLAAPADPIVLVGTHGAEFGDDFETTLGAERLALLARIGEDLDAIAARHPGTAVERKPASAVLHVRNASDPDDAAAALDAAAAGPATLPGVHTTHGKAVLELAVIDSSKGTALRELARRADAAATVFLGDDVTDEKGFAVLGPADVGIRVGEPPAGVTSAARHRVEDAVGVAEVLEYLLTRRGSTLAP